MAQKVFPQWSPVVKALNGDQQEVYIPAAIIHAQTRDGEDELIVGAANMQFDPETGYYLPTHAGNPVEVRARALETLLQTLGKEETLALVKAALDVLVSKDFATQTTLAAVLEKLADLATESTLDGVKSAVDAVASTVDVGAQKVTLTGSNVEILAEYQGYTGHNPQAGSPRYFGATVGMADNFVPLDVRRFGGLVIKVTNGYNVAVDHRVIALKVGDAGPPFWIDVTQDASLPAGAEFVYEIPNRYPYIALRVFAPPRDQTGETGLDIDIVGSVFYA